MMGLTALFAPAAVASPIPLGFFGEEGGSFQNNDGNMNVSSLSNGTTGNQIQDNIPKFAQGVTGYQAPKNVTNNITSSPVTSRSINIPKFKDGVVGYRSPNNITNNITSSPAGRSINIPSFSEGISGYHVPDNIAMDTMSVMVGGGEELDVRSIGQVSDRDNLLKQQIEVLNKIVTTLYATQTRIGDIAIRKANNNGKILMGEF